MNRCIISAAFGSDKYLRRLRRLKRSLSAVNFDGDFLGWEDTLPQRTPAHFDAPYAFKAYCFMEAKERGYEQVLWVDTSCVFLRSPELLFEKVQQRGYLLYKNRDYVLGEWCSDKVLDLSGIPREEAFEVPEALGTVLGLDMKHRTGRDLLDRWYRGANDGISFRGVDGRISNWEEFRDVKWNRGGCVSSHPRVRGHRHDQSVLGLLAYQMNLPLDQGGEFGYNIEPAGVTQDTVFVLVWRWRRIVGNMNGLGGTFLLFRALVRSSVPARWLRKLRPG